MYFTPFPAQRERLRAKKISMALDPHRVHSTDTADAADDDDDDDDDLPRLEAEDEDVDNLAAMFPDYDRDVLATILSMSSSLDDAIQQLLASAAAHTASVSTAPPPSFSSQVAV